MYIDIQPPQPPQKMNATHIEELLSDLEAAIRSNHTSGSGLKEIVHEIAFSNDLRAAQTAAASIGDQGVRTQLKFIFQVMGAQAGHERVMATVPVFQQPFHRAS